MSNQTGAVAGGHDQSALQNAAHADDGIAVRHAGRAGDAGEEDTYRLSGSSVDGRDRRAGTKHDRPAHPGSSSAASENAGRVRLHAVAEWSRRRRCATWPKAATSIGPNQCLLIGECGTGKTHLLTGLCVAACRQKRRVRFTTAAGLVNELVEAKHQLQLRRVMARWSRYDLIAIDEVGYVPLAEVGAEFLFQVIAERAERTAVVLTTNLPFSEWTQVIPNARLCKALLDRITDRAHILETGTESYRFRRTLAKAEERSQSRQRRNELWKCRPVESLESQKQAFHPSHRPWKSRKSSGIPTFPQLRRLVPIYKEEPSKPALRPSRKPSTKGGPKQTAEMGQNHLPNA